MDTKHFKEIFNEVAKSYGFDKAFGGWFKESNECIAVLDLQKSNYGNYYQLNIKIFVQGVFGNSYVKTKDLVKKEIGDIQNGEPKAFRDIFYLDNPMAANIRKVKLDKLFSEFIIPFTNNSLTKRGIKELESQGKILLFPAVRKELDKLMK